MANFEIQHPWVKNNIWIKAEQGLDLSTPKIWSLEALSVETLYKTHELPQLVKLDESEQDCLRGDQTRSSEQSRVFLLHSSRICRKVLASNVYWDDSKQEYLDVGPKVVIPLEYNGWFWYLQDFGNVGSFWTSVSEVAKYNPDRFISRQALMCYRRRPARPGVSPLLYDRERIAPGQPLRAAGIYTETPHKPNSSKCQCFPTYTTLRRLVGKKKVVQYLLCKDETDSELLVDIDQKGEFVAIGDAQEPRKDQVYSLNGMLNSSKLPLLVKLSTGQPPATPCSFTGLLRLEEIYREETIVACTIPQNTHSQPLMMEFPTDSDIQLVACNATEDILGNDVVRSALEYCDDNVEDYSLGIKVVQNFQAESSCGSIDGENNVASRVLPPVPSGGSIEAVQVLNSASPIEETVPILDADIKSSDDYELIPMMPLKPVPGLLTSTPHKYFQTQQRPTRLGMTSESFKARFGLDQASTTEDDAPLIQESDSDTSQLANIDSRMNSFLADSIKHLKRMRDLGDISSGKGQSEEIKRELETSEEVDSLLDKIFKNDSMTIEQKKQYAKRKHGRFNSEVTSADVEHYSSQTICPDDIINEPETRPVYNFSYSSPDGHVKSQTFRYRTDGMPPNNNNNTKPKYAGIYPFKSNSTATSVKPVEVKLKENSNLNLFSASELSPRSSPSTEADPSEGVTDSGIYMSTLRQLGRDRGSISDTTSLSDESWIPPSDLASLSVLDVSRSLRHIGIKSHVVAQFEAQQIDGTQLKDLNEDLLKEAFPELNALDRKKIVDFRAGWRPKKL